MRLPDNNRKEEGGEDVLKEEQVINDFSCIILAFFLRCHPLCPVRKIMAVNFLKEVVCVRGGGAQKNLLPFRETAEGPADKGGNRIRILWWVLLCHPAPEFINFSSDCKCAGALRRLGDIREGVSVSMLLRNHS